LNWFDQHLKSRYGTFLEREKTLQKQEEEICLLRAQLDATQKQLAQKAKKDLTQSKRLSEVESLNQEISKKLEALQSTAIQTSNAHTLSGEQIKLLLLEIRQYLRLVRSEIKKKFGYVPSTISQAQVWERILIIMENLEHLFKKTGS
jgi:predicted RNase H-like nuclease (RuvC/YqgF family)